MWGPWRRAFLAEGPAKLKVQQQARAARFEEDSRRPVCQSRAASEEVIIDKVRKAVSRSQS